MGAFSETAKLQHLNLFFSEQGFFGNLSDYSLLHCSIEHMYMDKSCSVNA